MPATQPQKNAPAATPMVVRNSRFPDGGSTPRNRDAMNTSEKKIAAAAPQTSGLADLLLMGIKHNAPFPAFQPGAA